MLSLFLSQVPSDDSDIYGNTYAAYYRDLDAYQTLLLESDAVNWGQCFIIRGNSQVFLKKEGVGNCVL